MCTSILESLAGNQIVTISTLQRSYQKIDACLLARALAVNSTLISLKLHISLDDDAMCAINYSLKANSTLSHIFISSECFGFVGAASLAVSRSTFLLYF